MVNIFIIVPDIEMTAEMLDMKRLGKQRVEAKQIINVLDEYDSTGDISTKGWSSHPAVKSWIGYTNHLKVYFNIITREWIKRGYENNMPFYEIDETPYNIVPCNFDGVSTEFDESKINQYSFPLWVSFPPFFLSHQAALCRKNPKHYAFLLSEELEPFLENGYFWPCNVSVDCYKNWKFEYLEGLGSGCPAVYRIKTFQVMEWLKNQNVNPTSKRRITDKSAIYKDYQSAMEDHDIKIDGDLIKIDGIEICTIDDIDSGIRNLKALYSRIGYPKNAEIIIKKINS